MAGRMPAPGRCQQSTMLRLQISELPFEVIVSIFPVLPAFLEMLVHVIQVLALAATIQAAVTKPRDAVKNLQKQAIAELRKVKTNGTEVCSLSNAAVRKDW